MNYKIAIGDKKFDVQIGEIRDGMAQVTVNDQPYDVNIENFAEIGAPAAPAPAAPAPATAATAAAPAPAAPARPATPPPAAPAAARPAGSGGAVIAPIPGLILDIKVNVGDAVTVGQVVAVMEAMKMENDIVSDTAGTVKEIRVQKEAQVATGDVLMVIG